MEEGTNHEKLLVIQLFQQFNIYFYLSVHNNSTLNPVLSGKLYFSETFLIIFFILHKRFPFSYYSKTLYPFIMPHLFLHSNNF
jgi:hypothetical protein